MLAINGVVRNYAWGSHTSIALLRGVDSPTVEPEAELWFGAHPGDPAQVVSPPGWSGDVSLLQVIEADRYATLGSASRRYGRLPFLLKVLAAEQPLSLQAHPNRYQAAEGFAAENRAGIAIDAPHRNYKDTSPKPELVVALDCFDALAGFRNVHETVDVIDAISCPALRQYRDQLAHQPDATGLEAVFTALMTLPTRAARELTESVVQAGAHYLGTDRRQYRAEIDTVIRLAKSYPGDVGVVSSLLLNRISLAPGDGLFLDAGNLHAYLEGTAVEVMASSDNVLRGGLTPKHVDVPELLNVLDFNPIDPPIVSPQPGPMPGEWLYPTPAREFSMTKFLLTDDPVSVLAEGPRIVLSIEGEAEVMAGERVLKVMPGHAVFLSATDDYPQLRAVTSNAVVYLASVDLAR